MRRVTRLCWPALAAVTAVMPAIAGAQDPAVSAAKAVATEFLNAATRNDWATVVRLTDGQSLWEYVTRQRATYRNWTPEASLFVPTVELYMQQDSTMPRVAAEYTVRKVKEAIASRTMPLLLTMLADVERKEQIDSLSDDELYVRRLRATQFSYQADLAARQNTCTARPPTLPNPPRTVKGVALLSADDAVALYTEEGLLDELGPRGVDFHQLSMRRTSNGWRVVASEATLTFGSRGSMGFVTSTNDCGKPSPP